MMMRLFRRSPNEDRVHSEWTNSFHSRRHENHNESYVEARFWSFGAGHYRHSDFDADVFWSAVERFISLFEEMEHPEAIRIRRALDLAAAVEALGVAPASLTHNLGRTQECKPAA